MKILNKKLFFIVPIIALIIIGLSLEKVEIEWVKFFRLDKVFVHYNSQGNIDGKFVQYKAGKVYAIGNLLNGVKQGWETMYYENGKIQSRTFFVNGLPAGRGYLYNTDGKLAYSGKYKYGKPYGGWYQYYSDGSIKKYMLYDIDKLDKAISFTINYDIKGNLQLRAMSGLVVSPNIYSIDSKNKRIIPLSSKTNAERKFHNINDLYITVANPVRTRLSVIVKINQRRYEFNRINDNTIKISNAFSEVGKYSIFIESHLYDMNEKIINGINITDSLIKE